MTEQPTRAEREFIAILASLTATSSLAIECTLPAQAAIGAALGVRDGNQLQWLVSVYVVTSAIGALFCGPIADRFGRKPTMVWATLAFSLACAVCGAVNSFALLLALRGVQGLCGAAMSALPMSLVRDRFSGNLMAKTMSLVVLTFMFMSILAPSIGQAIFVLTGWRLLFVVLGAIALGLGIWVALRLPETLPVEKRRPINIRSVFGGWGSIVASRRGFPYIIAQTILMGAIYGYVMSGPQIIGQHFGTPQWFGLVFAITAFGMVISSFTNSRIVMRYGSRRISHAASTGFVIVGLLMAVSGAWLPQSLPVFVLLLLLAQMLIGFSSSNFGAISMEGFGHLAGSASGLMAFMRLFFGGLIGGVIGHFYNGTTVPLGIGFLIAGFAVKACIAYAESAPSVAAPAH